MVPVSSSRPRSYSERPRYRAGDRQSPAMAGHVEQAIARFQRVLALYPEDAQATYELAMALQCTNHVQEATELLRKVVAAEPENADALINLGMALSQAQQNKEAVQVLERAIALKPDAPVAHQDLASAYVQLNSCRPGEQRSLLLLLIQSRPTQYRLDTDPITSHCRATAAELASTVARIG